MSDQSPGPGSPDPEFPKYPGGPEGSAPPPPPPSPSPAQPTPEQPKSIATAVKLMWAGAGLALLSIVVSFVGDSTRDAIEDSARETDADITSSELDAAYAVGIGFAVVFGLITIGLWAWMAWKNGQGRSWARIVATVLGGLNVLFSLLGFAFAGAMGMPGGTNPLSIAISVANIILAVVIVVLLWRKPSSDYYNAVGARKGLS